jgi:hypothetical protein
MHHPVSLTLATLPQICDELSSREHEEFILIYRDRDKDEWVIDLNGSLDGLKVVELFNSFQGRMIEIMQDYHRAEIRTNP